MAHDGHRRQGIPLLTVTVVLCQAFHTAPAFMCKCVCTGEKEVRLCRLCVFGCCVLLPPHPRHT